MQRRRRHQLLHTLHLNLNTPDANNTRQLMQLCLRCIALWPRQCVVSRQRSSPTAPWPYSCGTRQRRATTSSDTNGTGAAGIRTEKRKLQHNCITQVVDRSMKHLVIIIYHNIIFVSFSCHKFAHMLRCEIWAEETCAPNKYFEHNVSLHGERRLSTAIFLRHPRIYGPNNGPCTHHSNEHTKNVSNVNVMGHRNRVAGVVVVFSFLVFRSSEEKSVSNVILCEFHLFFGGDSLRRRYSFSIFSNVEINVQHMCALRWLTAMSDYDMAHFSLFLFILTVDIRNKKRTF